MMMMGVCVFDIFVEVGVVYEDHEQDQLADLSVAFCSSVFVKVSFNRCCGRRLLRHAKFRAK